MVRRSALLLLALATSACSMLPGGGDNDRTAQQASAPRTQAASQTISNSPAVRQCFAQLGASGVEFAPLPDRYISQGCSNIGTVQLTALPGDYQRLSVRNIGPVTCPVSAAFAGWARYGVDRAARQILGSALLSIETFGSYSCRNVAGTGRLSAHATASAIDIAAFVLADGRRISVEEGWRGNERERQFLRTVHQSACKRFSTVLGPDYNSAHRDHLHLEGVIERSSYCR